MSVILASTRAMARQVLIRGRVGEAITGRGFDGFSVRVRAEQGAVTCALPFVTALKPGGWYAAHLNPGAVWPEFDPGPDVTLRVEITIPGRSPVTQSRAFSPALVALTDAVLTIGGQPVMARLVSGAPFVFDVTLDPPAVALQGTVLRGNDPADPITGATVTAAPTPGVVTDANGQFFIPTLPVAETVTLALSEGGPAVTIPFTPDYARRVNRVTLSLGG